MGSKSHDENEKTQRQGRRLCVDGGRDWSDTSVSHGTPRTAGNHQQPTERYALDSLLEPTRSQPR